MIENLDETISVRHPIRFKIFMVSLIPTIALLAAAFLNHQYLNTLGKSQEQILSQNYKSIRAAQESRKILEEIRNGIYSRASEKSPGLAVSADMLRLISSQLDVCQDNITEVGEKDIVEDLLNRMDGFQKIFGSFSGFSRDQGGHATAILDMTAGMISRIDQLVEINEEAMERADLETRLLAEQAQRNAAVQFGIIITAILVLSYFLSYRIAEPIMKLAGRLSETRSGPGGYPLIPANTSDEIGFLTHSFNQLFDRLHQYDRHREEILAAEKEKVRRAEEAKGRFIADISHQLKTPMTSLGMSIGMLCDRGDRLYPDKKEKLLETAREDCGRLAALINELVDLSRLEAMTTPRNKEKLDISLVVRESLAPLVKQADGLGISIRVEMSRDLPPITIDSFRFPWILTNLVGNALRYTDRGGNISLRIWEQESRFYFRCADTGCGISPEYLPKIFDRFTQFSERGKSGTIGLGLAIVKDIIEQHGGDIQVSSRIGEGTVFTFWIPVSGGGGNEKSVTHR
jgi:signal transduction histidine kinase